MSLHSYGQEAKIAMEESRERVADLMGANPWEVIFTGSATESNNFALKGVAFANKNKGKHIIISAIEHLCVAESAKWLKSQGFEITKIGVDKFGKVNPEDVKKAIKKDTILVSIIHASNEIGTIQPIAEIGKICRERGVCFHTDASQSFGKIKFNVKDLNVDLLTASSHKLYGPKGAACLYIKEGVKIEPLLHGGGQENQMRSSTVNIPAIIGFAKACEIAKKEMEADAERLSKLREKLVKGALKIKDSHLNGHPKDYLSNIVNFWFSYIEGESLIIQLDLWGVSCSTGSACSSSTLEPSHVLLAIGLKPQQAHGSLRVSFGKRTTEKDIDYLLEVLPKIIKQLRQISPFKRNF